MSENKNVFWHIIVTPQLKEDFNNSIKGDYDNTSDAIRDLADFYMWLKEALQNVVINEVASPSKPMEIVKNLVRQFIRNKEKQGQ